MRRIEAASKGMELALRSEAALSTIEVASRIIEVAPRRIEVTSRRTALRRVLASRKIEVVPTRIVMESRRIKAASRKIETGELKRYREEQK